MPAIPLKVQLFDAFMGSQEGIHSVILPDIFSSGGSKNVYIDKYARVAQIAGYTKQNALEFEPNLLTGKFMVRGLIPYRATAGGSITRKLLIVLDDGLNEWAVWASTDSGATATELDDFGGTAINMIPDWAQFGDSLYLTNGKIQPQIYNGTTLDNTGLTQSPTITSASSGNSGHVTGNVRYKLVSTIAGVRQNGSAPSTSLLVVGKQVSLSWTADANTNVDGYEIYRTTGTGTLYYYLATISGRTTVAYTDNISDYTIIERRVLEEHGDAPPVCYYCEPHKQRMWWLRTDTYPTRAYWSDPGDPQSVYAFNYLDFSDSETVGDVCTGALGNYEGLMIVFTEKALWSVSGTGAIIGDIVDWTKTRTNVSTGCVTHRAALRVPAGSKFTDQMGQPQTTDVSSIAYFTPLGDIRIFDGDNDLIVSHPLRDTIAGFNYAQRHKIHAVLDSANEQAIWFIPTASNGEPNVAVVWNYRYGVWYTWETMPFGASVELDTATDAALLLVGEASTTKGGYVYQFLSGTSFDGSNIDAQWMTKTLYGVNDEAQPALSHTKRWRWVDVLFRIDQDTDIVVEWLSGDAADNADALGSVVIEPAADVLISFDGSNIITANSSTIVVSARSAQATALLHTPGGRYLHDEGIRLRIGVNGTSGTWALEAMELAFQILPGLKRRLQ